MKVQVEEGIVLYSGLKLGATEFVFGADASDEAVESGLQAATVNIVAAIKGH